MRAMLARVEDEAARRAGFRDSEDRMAEEVNKSPEAYWTFQKIKKSLEPKEINISAENSAEALLAATLAQERGEIVEFTDVPKIEPKIETGSIDAEFAEVKSAAPFRMSKGVVAKI